ncbi:MAG TPA: electron transfer protein with DM13 domain protein [Cyanobacteria bacterium UBA11149]|nr:electron transfer protein with DM13 domain protein [Cyanobacteria bacterium UBA11367]HBE57916.1 electron transfer protein with DM13 domain protein [Cyanobacteria bacterium UBA11366]HBK66462.1 electron transfer protein with DM13 domain protein [Cyanobacteria bacterium UBA11166]HBR74829.1 electron transfer protein with DM13 domain protein [Cyanobacteria bacterium UBA11159]HBS69088.1 electron transfer protein with DM13 domain protein [Cyanobacteria bacterium UBA11153]HBW90937.1 electron transf
MKLKHVLLIGLIYFFTIGCQKGGSVNQPPDTSPVASSATATPTQDTPATSSAIVKSGTFIAAEKPTEGNVQIVRKNGKSYLELDGAFKTSEQGPDLVIILHRSDDILRSTKPPAYSIKEGDYAIIAPLAKFTGTQSYPIPDSLNMNDYKSAAIWCRKFNATFGVAKLTG